MQAWISCSFDSNVLVMFMPSILAYITFRLWTWGMSKIKLLSILAENFLGFSKAPNTTRLLHGNIKRACIHTNILNFSYFDQWLTVYGAFQTNNSQVLFKMADFFHVISLSCDFPCHLCLEYLCVSHKVKPSSLKALSSWTFVLETKFSLKSVDWSCSAGGNHYYCRSPSAFCGKVSLK